MNNEWIFKLDNDDINFLKEFLLSSGSLKKVAQQYDTSYHITRNRLDSLIKKVQLIEVEEDWYIKYIKSLALNDEFNYVTAKKLIEGYEERRMEK